MSRILVIGNYDLVSSAIVTNLLESKIHLEYAVGHADSLQRLRARSFAVVITSAHSGFDEDLALLEEIRLIRPAVKCIILAPSSTPDEVIAALRAHAFACFTAPFDPDAIADFARSAAADSEWRDQIEVVSARPGWVCVRANCHLLTAERLLTFANELSSQLSEDPRGQMMQALREILLNALDHGAAFNPEQVVEVTGIQTARSLVFYVRDPGCGFSHESLFPELFANKTTAAAIPMSKASPRTNGHGLLLAAGTVDELIYSEVGNEVILIKYLA
jgi:signal transduction histidine kinase